MSIMPHLRPVQPEFAEQWLPDEEEELPFNRVLRAGSKVLGAKKRLQRTIWIGLGVPVGFGLSFLPWMAWAAMAVALVGWVVFAIISLNNAKVHQLQVTHEAERGIKMVEPLPEQKPKEPAA